LYESSAEVLLNVILTHRTLRVSSKPILDTRGMESVETNKVGLVMSLRDVVETDGAIGSITFMLIGGKQIVYLFIQTPALLLSF